MKLADAIGIIADFRNSHPIPWHGGGAPALATLAKEFAEYQLPQDIAAYVSDFAPRNSIELEGQGNSICVYGIGGAPCLSARQAGYSFDASTGQQIGDSQSRWFMLGDEGADPIIVDLTAPNAGVLTAFHGEGDWEFFPIADTLGQFLICSTAVDFTLAKWGVQYRNEGALPAGARSWLDTVLGRWAGEHYELWMPEDD